MIPYSNPQARHSQFQTHNANTRNGSIDCPNCGEPIPVTFHALLSEGKLTCQNRSCRSVLRINQAQSGKALGAISKLKKALKDDLGHDIQ